MDDKKIFERDLEVYEIAGLFNGLSQEISMMGFSLSEGNLDILIGKLNRWQNILNLIKTKVEAIEIDKILND